MGDGLAAAPLPVASLLKGAERLSAPCSESHACSSRAVAWHQSQG